MEERMEYGEAIKRTPLQQRLRNLGVCYDAIDWVGNRTPAEAWLECPRGDWLLWYLEHTGADRRLMVLATAKCVEPVVSIAGDTRSTTAVAVALKYGQSMASDEELRVASADAANVLSNTLDAAANAAATAAAGVAAAGIPESATYTVADAAWAASYAAADPNLDRRSNVERCMKRRREYLQWCADIVREIFPCP